MNSPGQIPSTPKFQVKLNWKLVLFSLLLLPLLTGLGFWQLQRAAEKTTIQESWRRQQALAPVPFAEVKDSPQENFRRVAMQGQFDPEHYWLLENRVLDGNLGYEVLMPFHVENSLGADAGLILVNRGWLPAGAYRTQLPKVNTPVGVIRISGSLAKPSDNRFINEQANPTSTQGWPRKILEVDPKALSMQLQPIQMDGQNFLYERVLRIDAENAAAFKAHWQPINMAASKHRGYAVQWFSMAFVLVILTFFANSNLADVLFRRKSSPHS